MRRNKVLGVIIVIAIFCLFGFLILRDIYSPMAIKVEDELNTEYSSIHQLSGAVLKETKRSHKASQALVEGDFSTTLGYAEIREYYNNELPKLGWSFVKEENVREWGKDFGGKLVYFRKGDYTLTLQYAGEKENYGWTYAISISWGLH